MILWCSSYGFLGSFCPGGFGEQRLGFLGFVLLWRHDSSEVSGVEECRCHSRLAGEFFWHVSLVSFST